MQHKSERILAANRSVGNDTWETGLNNNDLIVGPSGSGKTRGYVIPNILQCSESLIVADTKGNLREQLGGVLEGNGYAVLELDLASCAASRNGYDPLDYIRTVESPGDDCGHCSEQDVMTVSAALAPVQSQRDPFWDYAARGLLASIIAYVMDCLPPREHTMESVLALFHEVRTGRYGILIAELARTAPDSMAASQYRLFDAGRDAEKMRSSIQGILGERLSIFAFSGTRALLRHPRKIDIASIGRRKTALFLRLSDTDRSMDRLASLFYSQALQVLCGLADAEPDGRLKVPVRFVLDDFAAAADCCIPDFDRITSVIRSREISVSIILQSLSQLEASYGHARAMTIVNNCDHLLYLGGQDVETARYISAKANKSVHTILQMPLEDAWLFTRGRAPEAVRRYVPEAHPRHLRQNELPNDHTDDTEGEMQIE